MAQTKAIEPAASEARNDGWCGWCGQVFVDQPDSVTDCASCRKSLAENPPGGPVEPNGSPMDFCLVCNCQDATLVSTSTST